MTRKKTLSISSLVLFLISTSCGGPVEVEREEPIHETVISSPELVEVEREEPIHEIEIEIVSNTEQPELTIEQIDGLDSENLARVLRRRRPDVLRCYQRGLAIDPFLEGRIEIQFIINSEGRPENVQFFSNELNNRVGNCIVEQVRFWRFPIPELGEVSLRISYIFSSNN